MNNTIEQFTREEIKNGLTLLPEGWTLMFKRMYSHKDLDANINDIVDNMPAEKLDWALSQVENSLAKQRKNKS